MRITVIGSAGRLGTQVARVAAARGHHVTGLARRPESAQGRSLPARAVRGDARDPSPVMDAVTNADAVITVLAGGGRRDPHRVEDSAKVLVQAMATSGVRRLIATSAYPIVGRRPALAMALLRRAFATAYSDAAGCETVIAESDLDWTIVRLNRLTDAQAVGRPHVDTGELDRPTGLTRADAAALLVDIAESGDYVRAAVNVRGRDGRG